MNILVNGKSRELANGSTINDLLTQLEMIQGRVAVELNTQIVPRSQHGSTCLSDGDRVEIVHAIGGG